MAKDSSRPILGVALKAAARLMETPGPRTLLVHLAERQFGIAQLREREMPKDAVPFLPLHLAGGEGASKKGGA